MRTFEPLALAPVALGFALMLIVLVVATALVALKRYDTALMLGVLGVAFECLFAGLAVIPISVLAQGLRLVSTAAAVWVFVSLMAALGVCLAFLPGSSIVELVGLFVDRERRFRLQRRWRYPILGGARLLGAFYLVWTWFCAFGPAGVLR